MQLLSKTKVHHPQS